MRKSIQNVDVIVHKLEPALIRATNYRLKVVREKQGKRKKIVERQKTKAMIAKCQRVRRRIGLSSEKKENDESNTGDETDPNQAGNIKNPLQL